MDLKEQKIGIPVAPPKNKREARKEALQQSATQSLDAIQTQLGDFKKIGTNVLIIGGVIVAAYAITELILPSSKNRQEEEEVASEEEKSESFIWPALKGVATSLLLGLAKDKLIELIEQLTDKNAKPITQ